LYSQKEDDVDRLEAGLGSARASLHSVETEMANIKAQISAKESECESMVILPCFVHCQAKILELKSTLRG
jgi:3-polyprenyl-4-hydroxybenzoate decarboxylase